VPCPPEIVKLVERFEMHRGDYHAGDYNETRLRREFLDRPGYYLPALRAL